MGNSCEISCDSVIEDCDQINIPTECKPERGKDKSDCSMPPCSTETREISCEGNCETPTDDLSHERRGGTFCEIRDPYHRRQLKRLARMRSLSAASGTVVSSYVDTLGSMTSHRQNQVAGQKLHKLLVTGLLDSESVQKTDSMKRPLGGKLRRIRKDRRRRRERKRIYGQARNQRASKLSGKVIRQTMVHRTRGIAPFHHSQTKRISEKRTKFIGA